MSDQEQLRARVANLEIALHAMWAMLEPLQPPDAQRDIGNMMAEHHSAMFAFGAEFKVAFEQPPAADAVEPAATENELRLLQMVTERDKVIERMRAALQAVVDRLDRAGIGGRHLPEYEMIRGALACARTTGKENG